MTISGTLRTIALLCGAAGLIAPGQTPDTKPAAPRFSSHPDFKPTPEVPAMPKALMKLPRTAITRAKYPVIDFHLHGRTLAAAEDYRKMIALMDKTGIGLICNMDGGFGKTFDQNMKD